ncbi:hypothetical protein CC2G_001790 [Coprinopsis cinerea AmutBmut pab1-1]|nr:hypothetical protein CC2G_001790 [Coprinopsis cinerea AmutBmut pab1-1]
MTGFDLKVVETIGEKVDPPPPAISLVGDFPLVEVDVRSVLFGLQSSSLSLAGSTAQPPQLPRNRESLAAVDPGNLTPAKSQPPSSTIPQHPLSRSPQPPNIPASTSSRVSSPTNDLPPPKPVLDSRSNEKCCDVRVKEEGGMASEVDDFTETRNTSHGRVREEREEPSGRMEVGVQVEGLGSRARGDPGRPLTPTSVNWYVTSGVGYSIGTALAGIQDHSVSPASHQALDIYRTTYKQSNEVSRSLQIAFMDTIKNNDKYFAQLQSANTDEYERKKADLQSQLKNLEREYRKRKELIDLDRRHAMSLGNDALAKTAKMFGEARSLIKTSAVTTLVHPSLRPSRTYASRRLHKTS